MEISSNTANNSLIGKGLLGKGFLTKVCAIVMMFCAFAAFEVKKEFAGLQKKPIMTTTTTSHGVSMGLSGAQEIQKFNSTVKFVFVIGLEGSGHHLLGDINKGSPGARHLRKIPSFSSLTERLMTSLFHVEDAMALFTAHCQSKYVSNVTSTLDQVANNLLSFERSARIQTMQRKKKNSANQKASSNMIEKKNTQFTMVMNAWDDVDIKTMTGVGMISYPNFVGDCRKLNYPNLDLLYQACTLAEVDCEHVYLYRDPVQILRSTVLKRKFQKETLEAIHLYISHLSIIHSQLIRHGRRTKACLGLFEKVVSQKEVESSTTMTTTTTWEQTWEPVYRMFGWANREDFERAWNGYHPSSPVTDIEEKKLKLEKYEPYLQSLYQIHSDVVSLCQEQANLNTV